MQFLSNQLFLIQLFNFDEQVFHSKPYLIKLLPEFYDFQFYLR